MKNKILTFTLTLSLLFGSINAQAINYNYKNYTDITVDQKLLDNKAKLFSFDELDKQLVAECDFNDSNYSDTLKSPYGTSTKVDGEGCYKIEKTDTTERKYFRLTYTPTVAFAEGDMYAFSCRIKTENVTGGNPKPYVDEMYGSKTLQTNNVAKKMSVDEDGWYQSIITFEISKNTTKLNLYLSLPQALTGTVYFDDFQIYKVAFDPLETVLVTPSYKGLIYGDDYTDINLDVLLDDRGGFYDFSEMELLVTLKNASGKVMYRSAADTLNEKMNFVFPSASLSEGDYYLRASMINKESGQQVTYEEHTIRKMSEDYRPDAYVDENGHYVKNGKKTFMTAITNSSKKNAEGTVLANYDTSYAFAKATGLDTVANYGPTWWYSGNSKTTFDAMRNDGITSKISLTAYLYSKLSSNTNYSQKIMNVQEDIPKFLKLLTDDYKDDKILEGYYLFDEINPYTEGDEVRWNNEILASYDLGNPTFGVANKEYDKYGVYTRLTDILGFDPYPITGKTDENGKSVDDIAKVGRSMRLIRESFPNRPVYYVLQGFKYSSNDDAVRPPTYDELRNMAWQAICEGAEGISWYSFHEMLYDEDKPLSQWETEVKTLMAEITSYEDAILSDEPSPAYAVSGGGDWLNTTVRHYNGKTYLFAVNNTFDEKSATVKIEGLQAETLSFEPLEVKLLSYTQDSVLSNQAELSYMGFFDGSTVYPMAKGENETIIYVPKDCGIISYNASVSENATLFIGSVRVSEKGRITLRNVDSFNVYVVSENGKKATTHRYRVVKVED